MSRGDADRCPDRWCRGTGGWRLVNGRWRVCVGQLAIRYEQADLARERNELSENPAFELDELANIYVKRGVSQAIARQVAQQLMAKNALSAHARDELGISEITTARPVQADECGVGGGWGDGAF